MADLTTRVLTEADWVEFARVLAAAFLSDPDEAELERERAPWEPQRSLGVYDGDRLIGGGAILTRDITLPGPVVHPVAAITFVGVAPDARRRGAFAAVMHAQLHGLHEAGAEPIAALWASQPALYGRYGYGVASRWASVTVPARVAFRPGTALGGRIEMLDADEAAAPMRAIHATIAARRVGWLSRSEPSWRYWLADLPAMRRSASAFRYVLHHGPDGPDGYAVFRIGEADTTTGPWNALHIHELAAATPVAATRIWRMLLDTDLVGTVSYRNLALDDPLPLWLVDPRGVLTGTGDQLWVRLVDLDRALAARRYAAPCDLVIEVTDAYCPWNAGRWRIAADADGRAQVAPSTAQPDLRCDTVDLAAAYLGGTRLTALAGAGRVQELRPGSLVTASRAFAGDAEPYCPELF